MASGNSRIRSSISPIRLDCSIRVYLNFARRKQEKLKPPTIFLCLHKPTSNYWDTCGSPVIKCICFFVVFFFLLGYLW